MLDYPYIYPLAEEKLFCTHVDPRTNMRCTGMIDYDDGFNHLLCRKCGTRYLAADLEDKNPVNDIIINRGGRCPMKIAVIKSDGTCHEPIMSSSVMERRTKKITNRNTKLKISVTGSKVSTPPIVEEQKTSEVVIKDEKKTEEVVSNTASISGESDAISAINTKESSSSITTFDPYIPSTLTTKVEEPKDDKVENVEAEIKEEKKEAPVRDANGRFAKKSSIEYEKNTDIISKIEDSGVSKYPASKKTKKSGGAKKASGAKTSGVNSKFIPSPGVLTEEG